jgi:hypothetical protein
MALYDPARLQLKADVIPIEQAPFYAYTAAAVEAASLALAEQEGRGGGVKMAYSGPPVSNLCITAIELLTNKVIRLTITYPWDGASYPEGCFTSRVDLLAAPDLLDRWCELLATTNVSASTNWIEWTDSTASNSTLTPRFYWAGNADLDSDGDGFADAREILMYHSDPANSNSLPVNISGTVTYSGTETGLPLRVLAVTVSNSWATGCSVTLAAPGAYTNAKVATLTSYWFKAFVDVNGNSQREDWEPAGVYSNVALYVTNSRSGVDITVTDVPSLWGTLTYTSAYTEGTVYALACTASNSWSPTHAQSTPWYQNARTDPFTGQTYDGTAFPSNYCILGMPASNYYAKAFVDVDQSGALTAPEPAGFYTNNPVAVSGRVTNVNIVLDRDSDGDGLPDWWEMDNFGNLGQTASGDGDGDGVNNLGEYRQGSDPNCATTTEAPGGETVGLAVYTPLE